MKFLSKIISWLPSHKSQLKVPSIWAFGIVLLIVLSCIILINKFALHKEEHAKIALESGQRLEVSIKTGEITGKDLQPTTPNNKDIPKIKTDDTKESPKESENQTKQGQIEMPIKEVGKDSENNNQTGSLQENSASQKSPDMTSTLSHTEESQNEVPLPSISIKNISAKPLVIIIIKGMGLSSSSTSEALELPKEITMGFSPYSPSLDEWVKKSKASGHESILNIPMETQDYNVDNPGPYSLLTKSSEEDNLTRLRMLLGLTKNYSAIYSENSEVFTHSASSIKPILEVLKKENKYFIYGGGYANYSLIQVADSINYPILVNDLVLDDDISANAINDKFNEIEKVAKEKGYVVVMAHPYPITVRMLKSWLPKIAEKGLVVSPVSILLGKTIK